MCPSLTSTSILSKTGFKRYCLSAKLKLEITINPFRVVIIRRNLLFQNDRGRILFQRLQANLTLLSIHTSYLSLTYQLHRFFPTLQEPSRILLLRIC